MFALLACSTGSAPVVPLERVIRTQADADALLDLLGSLGKQERPPPVRVVLDGPATLLPELGYIGDETPLDIELDGGGALLSGHRLRLEGRQISVHDLSFAGEHPNYALEVVATESIRLSRLHIADAPADLSGRHQFRGGAIHLAAIGPSVQVDADNVVIVDAKGSRTVLLDAFGGGRYGAVTWREGRFGACPAPEFGGYPVSSFTAAGTLRMKPQAVEPEAFVPEQWLQEGTADWQEVPFDHALLERWRARP